ncbi:hypothetical protein I7I51_07697 [Histoplasma capsulatum]|uniref:Uncharacterized protein n=1 Tax=Ajellomyces capsulatus TaxID=5037 RepID=A0A8A1M0S6_AJECA|nr:hypothetical protein I7I51_07697 [Histoplasma capsulatum]
MLGSINGAGACGEYMGGDKGEREQQQQQRCNNNTDKAKQRTRRPRGPSERTSPATTGFKELFWGWSMFGRGACLVLQGIYYSLEILHIDGSYYYQNQHQTLPFTHTLGAPDGVELGALVARSLWKNWTCTVHGAFSQPDGIDALSIQGTIQSDSTSTANQVANSISPKQRSPRRWNGGTAEGSRPPPTNISRDELLTG